MRILQYLIVRLGGMEMAYEFLRLHPPLETDLVHTAQQWAEKFYDENGPQVADSDSFFELCAEQLFDNYCRSLIEADRAAAQAANSKW